MSITHLLMKAIAHLLMKVVTMCLYNSYVQAQQCKVMLSVECKKINAFPRSTVYTTTYIHIKQCMSVTVIYFPNFLINVSLFEQAVCDCIHYSLKSNDKSMLIV